MKIDIGSESRFLLTPPAFDAPFREWGSRRNIVMPFGVAIQWCKQFDDTIICFDRIHERDGRTDTQIDTA